MGITARDLVFVLKARDEATNVFTSVSRDILRIGAAAQAAGARAEAAALRQRAAETRSAAQAVYNADRRASASLRQRAAQMEEAGATEAQINALRRQARAYDDHANEVRRASDETVRGLHTEAQALEAQARSFDQTFARQQRHVQALKDISSASAMAGIAMVGLGGLAAAAMFSMVQDAAAYEKQVALTQTQVDGFSASMEQLGEIGKEVASKIAVPFEEVQPALYNIFSSTDANLQQATDMLKAFAKAAVAGAVSIDEASVGTMGVMNAFKIPFEDVNKVLDIQFQLVRKGVGTYAQFNSVMGRISPSAARAGQDLKTTAAMLAFLTRNGLSAASAAAAGARALDAFSNPKAVSNLEALGIKMKNTKGEFLPLVDILDQLQKKMKDMTKPQRAAAIQDIFKGSGGTIQARRFIDMALDPKQFAAFKELLGSMEGSAGQFENAYAKMADTTAAKTQLLKNNWDILKVGIGQDLTPAFDKLLDKLNELLDYFNGLSPRTRKILANVLLIATVFLLVLGSALLLLAGIGALAAGIAALGLGLGEAVIIVVAIILAIVGFVAAIQEAWRKSAGFRSIIKDLGKWLEHLWKDIIVPFAREVAKAFNEKLMPAFHDLAKVIEEKVLPAFQDLQDRYESKDARMWKQILNDLKEVITFGFEVVAWVIEHALIPALKWAADMYMQHKELVDKVLTVLMWLAKWYLIIAGSTVIGALLAALALLFLAFAAIAVIVGGVIWTFSGFIEIVKGYIKWMKVVWDWTFKVGKAIWDAFDPAKALGHMTEFMNTIKDVFLKLMDWFRHLGSSMIDSLIQGWKDNLGSLKSFLGSVTDDIKEWKGPPAKDAKLLTNAGGLVLKSFIRGLNGQVPALRRTLQDMTKEVNGTVTATIRSGPPVVFGPGMAAPRTINVPITVNTQEIRPKYHAEMLGALVAGRIS